MNTNDNHHTSTIFPKGDKAPAEYFKGTAWVKTLVANDDTLTTVISNVVFEPGARNNWHTHPAGQILICTEAQDATRKRENPFKHFTRAM